MKRTLALLLAIIMLAATVASCGAKTDTTVDTTTAAVTDQSTTVAVAEELPTDTLPPEEQDTLPDVRFDGETFTALLREDTKYELQSEEISGDLLSDAVYQRNLNIEERFGVKIRTLTAPGGWDDREDFIGRVTNSVLGGDHEFDMVLTHNSYMNTMPIKGLAYDLATLENLDFSKKWWHSGYMDNAEINGAIYTAAGDIGVTVYEYLEVVFFNKKIAEENQWQEDMAMERFIRSKVYALLSREETKLWQYSACMLAELFEEERAGALVLPEV